MHVTESPLKEQDERDCCIKYCTDALSIHNKIREWDHVDGQKWALTQHWLTVTPHQAEWR